uniref:beta-mannosidase n=1 Tax=Oryzias sinensis TaxID=183150 RepID=A0A8C7WTV1_9TELE
IPEKLKLLPPFQDPYFRFNDVSYRWIALENWTYSTTFAASAQQEVELIFDGVDTVASITLNGNLVGKTDNMFRRYVTDNLLQVQFLSPVVYASERSKAHQSYRVPPQCPPDVQKGECHVNFIRKEQSSFSWDWGPSFPTMGLWRDVRLEGFDALQLQQLSYLPLYSRFHLILFLTGNRLNWIVHKKLNSTTNHVRMVSTLPHSKKALVPMPAGSFLCGVCMFWHECGGFPPQSNNLLHRLTTEKGGLRAGMPSLA